MSTEDGRSEPEQRSAVPIEAGNGPDTIRAVRAALDAGKIPGTYVSSGRVVHVESVSGTATAETGDDDSPLPVASTAVGPPELAHLLAAHTYTYRTRYRKDGDGKAQPYNEEVTPPTSALAAALAPKEWPRLRPLAGIVGAPVLRRDGTLLQKPGYDPCTGLYLASKVQLGPVPEEPTGEQVEEARTFILDHFLGDFIWAGKADKANYIAFQVTPILQRYLRTLVPFGLVTSTMPGSGKTILTCGLGMLYGQRVLTWTHSDEELRKAVTSVLADPAGTIIFDNLAEGSIIDSAVLAHLITERTWTDRLLGRTPRRRSPTTAYGQPPEITSSSAVICARGPCSSAWTRTCRTRRTGRDRRSRTLISGFSTRLTSGQSSGTS